MSRINISFFINSTFCHTFAFALCFQLLCLCGNWKSVCYRVIALSQHVSCRILVCVKIRMLPHSRFHSTCCRIFSHFKYANCRILAFTQYVCCRIFALYEVCILPHTRFHSKHMISPNLWQ